MNKPRVLLVDDGLSVLDALGTMLESEGFELVRAADAHEAVEKFRQQPIDIVQLDLNMPVKAGWDTLERSRPSILCCRLSSSQRGRMPIRLRWTQASPR